MLELFGRSAVSGCWSGLYGLNATREGIKELLSHATVPQVVFRVECEVPGEIVTRMTADKVLEMGYLNVRYADAELMDRLRDAWGAISGYDDADVAMRCQPHLVREVLARLGLGSLQVVIHPLSPAGSDRVLTVGTVLSLSAVSVIRCRQPGIHVRLD